MLIKLSQDRKVQGVKNERNSIGLPVVKSCPGATTECIAKCYAGRGMMTYPNARNMYEDNFKSIKMLLEMGVEDAAIFIADEIRTNNKSGIFRWNIGGDIFSVDYLHAMVLAAGMTPNITHWVYTRSFKILGDYWANSSHKISWDSTAKVPHNLKINLSFDNENIWVPGSKVLHCAGMAKTLESMIYTVTWMGDKKDAQKFFPDRKWITCPELTGKIPLQGACASCKLCFGKIKDIEFNKRDVKMFEELGMPFTIEQKYQAIYHANKERGRKIGIHFPTSKSEGRK